MTSFHHFLASADREEPAAGLNPPWISPLFSSHTQKATRRSKGGVHTKIPKELESAVRETAGDPRIGRGTDGKTFSHPSFNTTHTSQRVRWRGWFLPTLPLGFIIIPFSSPFYSVVCASPLSLLFSRMPPATSFSLLSFSSSFLFFFFLLLF